MGFSEKDCCIKCDKGGKLLSCSDSSCPIAVHEKCMGVKAKFDEIGNFYCPYCLYRRVTEELRQAREKAVSGKKALSSFIDLNVVNGDTLAHGTGRSEGEVTRRSPVTEKENDVHGYDYSGLQVDDVNAQKNHIQLEEDKEKAAPECTIATCPSNGIHMPSINARPGDCGNQLMSAEHQRLSGHVGCGDDDSCSEEEGITQRFEMVKIVQRKLQHHNQMDDNHVESVEDHLEENHFEGSHEAGKQGLENEFSSSMENASTDAKPSEENEGTASEEVEMEDGKHLEDLHVGDSLGAEMRKAGSDLSSAEVKPSGQNIKVSAGKEEMEEQAEESSSSFDSDAAAAVLLNCRGEKESSSSGKHVRHNSTRRDPNDGSRRSHQNRSSMLRPVAEQTKKNSPSNEFKKHIQSSTVSTRNLVPSSRRKKLLWSEDEVEMLQEGVQKFSTAINKNIPWRKILEFGRHVFHWTRSPQDLKDKWRNISPKEN